MITITAIYYYNCEAVTTGFQAHLCMSALALVASSILSTWAPQNCSMMGSIYKACLRTLCFSIFLAPSLLGVSISGSHQFTVFQIEISALHVETFLVCECSLFETRLVELLMWAEFILNVIAGVGLWPEFFLAVIGGVWMIGGGWVWSEFGKTMSCGII